MGNRSKLFVMLCSTALLPSWVLGSVVYVDAALATGANDGSSWADAHQGASGLQTALTAATTGDEIWVAEGVCVPGSSRTDTFQMASGVVLYGGFENGDVLGQRDYLGNETILSGDIGVPADNSDNIHHVVTASGVDSTSILDGFVIQDGLSEIPLSANAHGAGIFNSGGTPIIRNCVIRNNSAVRGGGMHNQSAGSAVLENVLFHMNSADDNGGALYNQTGSDVQITDCTFTNNSAEYGAACFNLAASPIINRCTFTSNSAEWGGALSYASATINVSDCLFIGNSAVTSGGGLSVDNTDGEITNCAFGGNSAMFGGAMGHIFSNLVLTNCTFAGNSASGIGAGILAANDSHAQIRNSIFWGNTGGAHDLHNESDCTTDLDHCLLEDAALPSFSTGTANVFAQDPLFVAPFSAAPSTDGDMNLQVGSPAIDTGNNSVASPSLPLLDLAGNGRIYNGVTDMGAYESMHPAYVRDWRELQD